MKHTTTITLLSCACCLLTATAAVPLSWTVETSRAQPATFEAYQGETLTFEAALQSHGKPLEAPLNYSFYWQTNGMGNVYWSTNCTVPPPISAAGAGTNVLFATWSPSMDVGAKVYNCFIGEPGTIYHAAFQLRLRPSPGETPNELPLPQKVIDFAKVKVLNPPWSCGTDTNAVRDIVRDEIVPATNGLASAAYVDASTNRLYKTLIDAMPTGDTRLLPRYAHFETMDDTYADEAAAYYAKFDETNAVLRLPARGGGCSAVRIGNQLGRNFDWNFDETPEWVVKVPATATRHGSVCVSVFSSGGGPTEDEVNSGAWTNVYRLLPGVAVDGINDAGVVVEVNVIPTNSVDPVKGVDGRDLSAKGVVRWVLDNASSASNAAAYVAAHYYIPAALRAKGYSYHWMIADERETWVVEDGRFEEILLSVDAMTNFRYIHHEHEPDDWYGSGYVRWQYLKEMVGPVSDRLSTVRYSNAYVTNSLGAFPWPDEFAGSVDAQGPIPYYETDRLQAWAAANVAPHLPLKRASGASSSSNRWWQTVHSSIYDISNRTVSVCFQEDFANRYTFACPKPGTDEQKVREIAGEVVAPVAAAVEGKADKSDIPDYETDPVFTAWKESDFEAEINAAVNANLNTYIDGETGVEYEGKFYGGSLYYVPTGNVYPPNN